MSEGPKSAQSFSVMTKQLALVFMGLLVLVLVLVIAGALSDGYYTKRAAEKQEQLGRQNAFASGMTYEQWLKLQADRAPGHEGETPDEHAEHAGPAGEAQADAKEAAEWAATQGSSSASTPVPQGEPQPPTVKGQMVLPMPDLAVTPEEIEAMKTKAAVIHTTVGSIPVELWPDKAPRSVKNFLYLAKNNFYSGLYFHRLSADGAVLAGSPNGIRGGTAGYWFPPEGSQQFPSIGTICALPGVDANMVASEFALMLLGGGQFVDACTPFGRVLDRYNVVEKIADTSGDKESYAVDRVYIESVEIVDRAAVAPKEDYWAKYGK